MTIAAVWKVGERLYAIADTRIIRSPNNVLTEHGPKLLPIRLRCKQPGGSGFFDQVSYDSSIGFAYAGSTLSALSTHAFSNTMCQNLAGPPSSPPPDLNEVSLAVGKIAHRYMLEIGQIAGADALFSALIFGFCLRQDKFRAFELMPMLQPSRSLELKVEELDLSIPENLLVIGSQPELLRQRVYRNRPNLYAGCNSGAMDELREIDLPRRALAELIQEEADGRVGGSTQEAWVTRGGFEPVSKMVPVTGHQSGGNATMMTLGFDMYDFDSVGSYFFSLNGRV